jgi:hypothetical protein
MAHFYKGKYRGLVYEVFPYDFRRIFLFRSYPYHIGENVKIIIRANSIESGTTTRLNNLQIYAKFSNSDPILVTDNRKYPDNAFKITIDSFPIPSSGTIEYWIDVPNHGDARKLVDIQGNWKDQKWIMVISAVVGFIIGFIGNQLVNLITKINK